MSPNPRQPVIDPLFDGAVARDLAGTATKDDMALLYEDPWSWRKLLGIRANLINTADAPSVQTVDVTDSAGRAWSFRMMVRGMTLSRRQALFRTVMERIAIADKLKRDEARDKAGCQVPVLHALICEATTLVPPDHPWHAKVAAYCERFRNGVAFEWENR